MKISLKTGQRTEETEVKDELVKSILMPKDMPQDPDEEAILQEAFCHPLGTPCLKDIVKPGETVTIITSDITRPCPSYKILPHVIEELSEAGIRDEDITILFGRGSHRAQSEEEMIHLAGKGIYERIRCTDTDFDDTVHYGNTKRGTPVDIDRRAAEADRRILIGNVEYHYFAGFSGGAKALMPGASTPQAIQANHRLMTDPASCTGRLEGNPVREDIEEAAAMVGADFIINVVLNTDKKIVYAAAGDMHDAHRKACAYLDERYACAIDEKADIVLVSQGGAPKDINLYQTQKALDNAGHAVKDNGTVILVGSCKEGFGNPVFESWMKKYRNPKDMIDAIHEQFRLGGHKAAAIAMIRARADIFLVSDMAEDETKETMLKKYASLQEAYEAAQKKYDGKGTVIVMPYGGSTLPKVKE